MHDLQLTPHTMLSTRILKKKKWKSPSSSSPFLSFLKQDGILMGDISDAELLEAVTMHSVND